MAQANAENRLLAQNARDGSVSVRQRGGIGRSVRQKNPIRVSARESSALDPAGITLTRKPVATSRRKIFSLIP